MQMATSLEADNGEMIVKRVSVPIGLEELMEGLTKEVILKKPKDICVFASEYFANLLNLREKGSLKVPPGKRIQSITKQISVDTVAKQLKIKSKSVDPVKSLSRQRSIQSGSPTKKPLTAKKIVLNLKEDKNDKTDKTKSFLDKRRARKDSKDDSSKKQQKSSAGQNDKKEKKTLHRNERSVSRSTDDSVKTPRNRVEAKQKSSAKINHKVSPRKDDKVINHLNKITPVDNKVAAIESPFNTVDVKNQDAAEVVDDISNNKGDIAGSIQTDKEIIKNNESEESGNMVIVGCTMKSDVALDKTTENMQYPICDTPKDVERITSDQNENENDVTKTKKEQENTSTSHSVDEVDYKQDSNTEDLEKPIKNINEKTSDTKESVDADNDLIPNKGKPIMTLSNSNNNDDDIKNDEQEKKLDSEAEKVTKVKESEKQSVEQSSVNNQHVLEVTENILEDTTITTQVEKEQLDEKSTTENESKSSAKEIKNVNLNNVSSDITDTNETSVNTENTNQDMSPNHLKENSSETKLLLDDKHVEDNLQNDQENKENIDTNKKEINVGATKEINKKTDDSKESLKLKNIRTKSLSEERLKINEHNKDKDKKIKRIKSVASNKNNSKKFKSQSGIDPVSNKNSEHEVLDENKDRSKTSLAENVDNVNTKESDAHFDSSKLHEEIGQVTELSKMSNFKTSYNPYKLRQEIRQVSEDSENNTGIVKAASDVVAAIKIQSIWRGYASRKSIENIKQIPRDIEKPETGHVNIATDPLPSGNTDVIATEERKNDDVLTTTAEKSEDTLKSDADSTNEDATEKEKDKNKNSVTIENVSSNIMENTTPEETTSVKQKSVEQGEESIKSETIGHNNKNIISHTMSVTEESNLADDRLKSEPVTPEKTLEAQSEEATYKTSELEEHTKAVNVKKGDISKINSTQEEDKNDEKDALLTEGAKETGNKTSSDMIQEIQNYSANGDFVNSKNQTNSKTLINEATNYDISKEKACIKQQSVENITVNKSDEIDQEHNTNDKNKDTTEDAPMKQQSDKMESDAENFNNILLNTDKEISEQVESKPDEASSNVENNKEDENQKIISLLEDDRKDTALEETITKKNSSNLNSENINKSNINEEQTEGTINQNVTEDKKLTPEDKNVDQNIRQNLTTESSEKKELLSIAGAVTRIQAIWRGFKVRKQLKHEKFFGSSVKKEIKQKEALEVVKKIDKHAAVSKIQAVWRGYKVRKNIKDVDTRLAELQKPTECDEMPSQRELSDDDIFKAATKIQAGVRGYMVRKKRSTGCSLKSISEETTPEVNMADEDVIKSIEQLQNIPRHSPELTKNNDNTTQQVEKTECLLAIPEKKVLENLENLNHVKLVSNGEQVNIPDEKENVNNTPELSNNCENGNQQLKKSEHVQPHSDAGENNMYENLEKLNNTELQAVNDKSSEKQINTGSNIESVDNQMTGNEAAKNNEMINTKEDNKKTENEVEFIAPELNSSTTNKPANLDTTALIDDTISNSNINKDKVDPVSSIIHGEPGYEDAPTRPVTSNKLQESTNNQNIEAAAEKHTKNQVNENIDKDRTETIINKIQDSTNDVSDKQYKQELLESQDSTTSADSLATVISNDTEVQPVHLSQDESEKKPSKDGGNDTYFKDKTEKTTQDTSALQECEVEQNKEIKSSQDIKEDNSINKNIKNIQEENVCDSVSQLNNSSPVVKPEIKEKILKEHEAANEIASSERKVENVGAEIHTEENQTNSLNEIGQMRIVQSDNLAEINNNLELSRIKSSQSDFQSSETTDHLPNDSKCDKPSDDNKLIANSKDGVAKEGKEDVELIENKKLGTLIEHNTVNNSDADLSILKNTNESNQTEHDTSLSESKTDDSTLSSNATSNSTPVSQLSMENNKLNLSALESEIINANKHIQDTIAKNSEEIMDSEGKDSNTDNSSADETKTDNSLSMSSTSENNNVSNKDSTTNTEKENVTRTDKDVLRIHIPLRELSEIKEEDVDTKSTTDSVEDLDDESKSSKSHTKSVEEDEKKSIEDNEKTPEIQNLDGNVAQQKELESKTQDAEDCNNEKAKSENINTQDEEMHKTHMNDQEASRKKSASPIISLVHSGEFHDTITVPISVSPPATSSKEGENQANVRQSSPQGLVNTGELHDHVLPLSVQLNEAPPAGAEILTSQASESINIDGQKGAQASNKDASACETQPDNTTSSTVSMETEKRNNATTLPKKSMEVEAATKIQAGFRGYKVRKQLKKIGAPGDISNQRRSARRKSSGRLIESGRIIQNKSKSPSDIEEKSAVKIQAGVRGFLVRRRQKKQKQGKKSSS